MLEWHFTLLILQFTVVVKRCKIGTLQSVYTRVGRSPHARSNQRIALRSALLANLQETTRRRQLAQKQIPCPPPWRPQSTTIDHKD